ncbi:MAG: NifU family protein [Calditrichota bacterium]
MDRKSVETAIDQLRPSFTLEGGDIHLLNVQDNGVVEVSLSGTCHGCAMSLAHLKMGVEMYLKQMVPGVTEVIANEM